MRLLIDVGNTRIKWAWVGGAGQVERPGVCTHEQAGEAGFLAAAWAGATEAVLCNVAGEAVGEHLRAALVGLGTHCVELRAQPELGGVVNGYRRPQRLGADRWAALQGAWALGHAPCVVVMAGTATTVDALESDGYFPGGFILPGLDMMRRALAQGTADLPLATGRVADWPRETDDAIMSGCVLSQVALIERTRERLAGENDCPTVPVLLAGGNAGLLLPQLAAPVQWLDALVLEGLRSAADSLLSDC